MILVVGEVILIIYLIRLREVGYSWESLPISRQMISCRMTQFEGPTTIRPFNNSGGTWTALFSAESEEKDCYNPRSDGTLIRRPFHFNAIKMKGPDRATHVRKMSLSLSKE